MRRLISLLFSLILAAFLISCSNSIAQESSITIDAGQAVSKAITVSRTIKNRTIPQKGESDLTDAQLAALDKAMELSVDLKVGVTGEFEKSVENNYSFSLSQMEDPNPQNIIPVDKIRITSIPVGKKVKVSAQLIVSTKIKDASALVEFALAEEDSELSGIPQEMLEEYILSEFGFFNYAFIGESQQITIHEGENPVSVPLQFDENYEWEEGDDEDGISGEIEPVLPEKLTIQIKEKDDKLFLNKGTIAFKLVDENGNEVEPDPTYWSYKLSLKNTEIPVSISSDASDIYCFGSAQNGTFEIRNLPVSGTYSLYVQAQPTATGYTDCATTSAMFDVVVVDSTFYSYNAANLMDGDDVSSSFMSLVDSITTDCVIKLSGTTSESYNSVLGTMRNYITRTEEDPYSGDAVLVFNYLLDLDLSEMTTTAASKWTSSGYDIQNFVQLRSIIFPDDLPELNDGDFAHCTDLESITFGSAIKKIGNGYDAVFMDCPKLSSVTIPSNAELQIIYANTFSSCSIKQMKLPESILMIGANAFPSTLEELILNDESGNWYFTDVESFENIANDLMYTGLYNPEEKVAQLQPISTLDGVNTNNPMSEQILYVVTTQPGYYYFRIK